MGLSDEQRAQLYKPIFPGRVKKREGKFSYVEAYDDIAHLGHIFGVENWDDGIQFGLVFEELVTWRKDGQQKQGWDVCYWAKATLTLKDPEGVELCTKSGAATGGASHQPSRADAHDLALKTAASDALKRAAIKLGDQFGLSLYDDGSTEAVVVNTLAYETKRA